MIRFITKRGASSPLAGGQVSTTLSSPWGVERTVHSGGNQRTELYTHAHFFSKLRCSEVYFLLPSGGVSKGLQGWGVNHRKSFHMDSESRNKCPPYSLERWGGVGRRNCFEFLFFYISFEFLM